MRYLVMGLALLAGLGIGGVLAGGPPPAALHWDRMWQPEGKALYESGPVTPILKWDTTKLWEERGYRFCFDYVGDGGPTASITLAVGDDGDPVPLPAAPNWTHVCITTPVGWGGGGATLPLAVYLRPAAPGITLRAPVLFAGSP